MARGGARKPTPNSTYQNRSDLRETQAVRTVPGQPYGEATAQAAQQQAIPLANGGGPTPSVAPGAAPPSPDPSVFPGEHGSLFDATGRPGEPVTAGSPTGAGPGPEALGQPTGEPPAVAALRAAYLRFPVEGLREILENLDNQAQ